MPRERANERACDAAIKNTLNYRSIFKYPMSFHQLYTLLHSSRGFRGEFFKKELSKMVKKGYIGSNESKYYIKSVKPISWETRYKFSKSLLEKNQTVFKILSKIPWIKMLCVTGSVAAYNADRNSDIDIFIVSQKNRVWITRGFVALILNLLGVYAKKASEPGKLCPNLFVDETQMAWPTDKRTIYTAHEIVLMQPIINKEQTYFKFIKENNWIFSYFPHFKVEHGTIKIKHTKSGFLLNKFENLAHKMQVKYMKNKITNEITDPHFIHFKKNDNADWILEAHKKTHNS